MSMFQNALIFFGELGVYDVILPFLLVFTIVFAMLEKSKVLGLEQDPSKADGQQSRKNLNAMVAFVSGFLVVASAELVRVVNEVMANSVLLLLMSVLFLMLVGSFQKDQETFLEGGWRTTFFVIMFIGIILIFMNALGWLQFAYNYFITRLDGPVVGSIIMLLVAIGAIWAVVGGGGGGDDKKK